MPRPLVHFVYANNFPSGMCRIRFAHLSRHYGVHALDMHTHNPVFPATDGSGALAYELECRQAGRAATRQLTGKNFSLAPAPTLFSMESPTAIHPMITALLPAQDL